jgi:hypothetical protein
MAALFEIKVQKILTQSNKFEKILAGTFSFSNICFF